MALILALISIAMIALAVWCTCRSVQYARRSAVAQQRAADACLRAETYAAQARASLERVLRSRR